MKLPATLYFASMLATTAMAKSCTDVLRPGSAESVGMLAEPLKDMVANMSRFTEAADWGAPTHNQVLPVEPGGTVLVARHGRIVSHFAFGKRNLWASVDGYSGTKLPAEVQEDAKLDTIYDMASLTKLFTTVAVLRCLDKGLVTLEGPVATWLPGFEVNGKKNVTLIQLLTHTSGFAPDPAVGLWMAQYPTYDSRIQAILQSELQNTPGSTYLYSDLNFMTLMLVVEAVTGMKHDDAVKEYTDEMGMADTFYNRGNVEGSKFQYYSRMATQEFQNNVVSGYEPERPQPVRGTVHDENAWALDGVSGHAGLFSTAFDTAKFCQMVLNNGTYNGKRILSKESVDLIFTNFNERFGPGNEHGVGFELNQYYTAGPMANLQAASHTGFTGTSLVIDRESDTLFVHLSNRVHPSRNWSSNNIARETLGAWVATALGRKVKFP